MKFLKEKKKVGPSNQIAFQGGSYSLIITGIVLAILVVLNVLVTALPTSWTKYDISSSKLYSITSNTKTVVNALEQDVTIYWIVQADAEDDIIENLLGKYESLSSHIEVVKKNPDVYPTFTEQYTSETVPNNSLIVESGERSRYISYDEIYLEETDMYSYSYTTSFDGEGAITSAIDYVISEELPILYTLEGHGESELPSTFANQITKENIEVQSLSLLSLDAVPEDADCVMIYAPSSDISEQEKTILAEYAGGGGKLLVMAGPIQDGTLTNLNSLIGDYGVTVAEGIVIENDTYYYASGYPYFLLPDLNSHEITDSLINENYYAIFPIAQGLVVESDSDSESETVTQLITTSATSYSKVAGYALETYDKEEGDIDGPFALGVSIATGNDGSIVWFSCSEFLVDENNAYSSGANGDLAMNALSSLMGEREGVSIRSKSLNYNYLTISESASATITTLMIGIFPLMYLGVGVCVIIYRKKVQNEAV